MPPIFIGTSAFTSAGWEGIFDNVRNLAAPERTGNVAAEERVLGCDLVSPAFGLEGLPAPVIVLGIGQPLADCRVMPEADEQLVDKRSFRGPEDIRIDAAVDRVIHIQHDARALCRHGRIVSSGSPVT